LKVNVNRVLVENVWNYYVVKEVWGSVVVKALRYKLMGLGIDTRWFH
jgi:hypothetical protein